MLISPDRYLQELIDRMGNGQIKVTTGVRRCGKSFLVSRLFRNYLREQSVPDDHVVEVALDDDDCEALRDVSNLSSHIKERISGATGAYYVLLDEVQLAITREEMRNPDVQVRLYGLLNSLLRKGNVDVYVTGSNSKMLSKDVATEFRGRGGVVEVSEKGDDGKNHRKKVEIDFVATKAPDQIYIQSALTMDDPDKARAELRPLLAVRDFFRKVVVSKTTLPPWVDDSGVIRMGIYDFLLDEALLQ